jgi:hypothetical protein
VSVWAENGNVSDTTVKLTTTPTSQKPEFTFGCGTNGSASCDLKTVDSSAATSQLQAGVTVPTTATTVKSVTLTVTGSATGISKDPKVALAVSVSAPAKSTSSSGSSTGSSTNSGVGSTNAPAPNEDVSSPLPVGNLPYLSGTGSTLSPGGNASGLFPTLDPSDSASGSQSNADGAKATTQAMADTSALPEGTSVIGAQLVGLIALALAFILAVTRLSIRKRPATTGPAKADEKDPK